jgi:glycine hydroxymethyltransferase
VLEDKVREVEQLVRAQNEWRLRRTINLIASENVLSERARATLSADFGHRYAEGHPGARYYQGTEYIDAVESRVRDAMKQLFGAKNAEVRTISGTNANDVVFSALVKWNDPVMVNSLPAGGHISHQLMGGLGKYTRNILPFPRTEDGWKIDVAKAKEAILQEEPKVVLFGKSMILFREPVRDLVDLCRERKIAIVYDGAHVLGLIAGKQFQDPLAEGADVLLGSTHKTFFGPQRGVVLSNLEDERWTRIDKMAFPGSLSNHHLFTLPALLIATHEMTEFGRDYAARVVANARALAAALAKRKVKVECEEYGFTETHQVIVNVKKFGGGGKVEVTLKENDIILNRNLLPRDPAKNVNNPSGLRIGVQEMTRFGMNEPEMDEIARLLRECVVDGKNVKEEVHRLRARFTQVHYSFDRPSESAPAVNSAPIDVDLAGY